MPPALERPLVASNSLARSIVELGSATSAVARAELRKLWRDPTDIFTRSVQPALWLLVFGQVFTRMHAIPTGKLSYLEFMAPGILAHSVLFSSIFYGINVIWERDVGLLHKMLVSPAHRSALVLGKCATAGVRGLAQGTVIYAVALLLGIRVRWDPAAGLRRAGRPRAPRGGPPAARHFGLAALPDHRALGRPSLAPRRLVGSGSRDPNRAAWRVF